MTKLKHVDLLCHRPDRFPFPLQQESQVSWQVRSTSMQFDALDLIDRQGVAKVFKIPIIKMPWFKIMYAFEDFGLDI